MHNDILLIKHIMTRLHINEFLVVNRIGYEQTQTFHKDYVLSWQWACIEKEIYWGLRGRREQNILIL